MWQNYIPNIQIFLVVNNLINMIEIVYIWLNSDSESYHRFKHPNMHIENSMLGVFSCDNTVVAKDVIMQRAQLCLGLSETHQVNQHIVIWLARALRALEASQHVIRLPEGATVPVGTAHPIFMFLGWTLSASESSLILQIWQTSDNGCPFWLHALCDDSVVDVDGDVSDGGGERKTDVDEGDLMGWRGGVDADAGCWGDADDDSNDE